MFALTLALFSDTISSSDLYSEGKPIHETLSKANLPPYEVPRFGKILSKQNNAKLQHSKKCNNIKAEFFH